jgi:fibronectin type 3 domain-containing protein
MVLSVVVAFGCGSVVDEGVSATASTVAGQPTTVAADGVATSTITVTLRDLELHGVEGKAVSLSSSRGATDSLSPSSSTTDEQGVATFTIRSSTAGTSVVTATDTTDAIAITQAVSITFSDGELPPEAPQDLTATGGNAQVTLSWDASAGATGYTVRRSTTSGSGFADLITGVAGTVYTDTTAVNDTTYYYVVRATNAAGTSGDSNEASATPEVPTSAPPTPTNLVATAGDGVVELDWGTSAGAFDYIIRRSTTSGSGYVDLDTRINSPPYFDLNATNGTTFYYVVAASNDIGTSANSNEVSATPEAAVVVPAAPTGLVATAGNAQVSLTWNAVSGADSYSVRRGTTSGTYTTVATDLTTASYNDTNVANGTAYFYVVVAVNSGGSSGNSNEATATPTAPLFQVVDSATFRTFANVNSSNGAVSSSSCTTANASCHAVDGNDTDTAHAWTSGTMAGPYLQIDSGNSSWGKHIDHFVIVYSTTSCSAGAFQVDYHPPGSINWNTAPGTHTCVANTKTTLTIPLNQDSWGMSIRNNAGSTDFTIYEVQFWTTN